MKNGHFMPSSAVKTQRVCLLSQPVVYHKSDYIGGFRHLLIFAVDATVLLIVVAPLALLSPLLAIILAWCYLAVLKPSRFRSPGYWFADAKIITLDGRSPSPFRMTLRLLWMLNWGFGWPIGFFIDWVWTFFEDERQMLRDLVAETRLVRNRATPIGTGRISYVFFTGLGLTLIYPRVRLTGPAVQAFTASPILEEPTEPVIEPIRAIRHHAGSIIPCLKCGMRVIPKGDGCCPSCQAQILSD